MNEIQRIKQLQPRVATFYEDIEEEKYKFVNREYDAHHCIMVYATQQVEEYQVISGYDIEIDYEPDINAAAYETFDEETKKQYDEDEGLYETFFEEHDPDEFAYNFFYAEVMQVWLNTRTGKATFLAKTRYDKQWLFDTEHDWVVINSGRKAPRYQKVYDYCKDTSGSGFWRDYSVHPALQQRGYTGIDAWDYDYYIGYVDDFSTNGKFAYNNNLITEFQKLLLGTSELEQPLKAFGIEDVLRIQEITDEQTRQAYVTALKIAKRHHYTSLAKMYTTRSMFARITCVKHIRSITHNGSRNAKKTKNNGNVKSQNSKHKYCKNVCNGSSTCYSKKKTSLSDRSLPMMITSRKARRCTIASLRTSTGQTHSYYPHGTKRTTDSRQSKSICQLSLSYSAEACRIKYWTNTTPSTPLL